MTFRVLVAGGGITGLTVALECLDAGAEVTVVEQRPRWGGKVLSYRLTAAEGLAGAPVEHSLRTFQSTYATLFASMKRIPLGNGTSFDTLRPMPNLVAERPGGGGFALSTAFDQPVRQKAAGLYRMMRGFGVPRRDIAFWAGTMAAYAWGGIGFRRRLAGRSFASFIAGRSRALRDFIGSIVEIIFAAKPDASAAVFVELFVRMTIRGRDDNAFGLSHRSNITNGPVNECLIDPWVAHLSAGGVRMIAGKSVVGVTTADRTGVVLEDGTRLEADAAVLAVTPSALAELVPDVCARSVIPRMRTELSAGMQFFLSDVPAELAARQAFTLAIHSPWSVIWTVWAPPLWEDVALPPGVAGVLTATVSCFDRPGVRFRKPFTACTVAEVQQEVLAQIGFTRHDLIVGSHLDPLLRRVPAATLHAGAQDEWRGWQAGPPCCDGHVWASCSPAWIFSPQTGMEGAPVTTGIPGLFMAGEFTDTAIKIPTMEKASQAGKLCAAAVLAFGATRAGRVGR